MISFQCNLWLLAEWNGDNIKDAESALGDMQILYEHKDETTFGFLVLANEGNGWSTSEFDTNKEYACDYKKIEIENSDISIGFFHAPPPVPTCDFETEEYIKDALDYVVNLNTKRQILVGDFNALPLSNSYKRIKAVNFTDVFKNNNWFAGTWGVNTWLPKFLGIDYCFIKGNIKVENAERFKVQTSDHAGLVVDLKEI